MSERLTDFAFGALCAWLKANKLEAVTRSGQTLLVYRKQPKRKLMVKDGRLVAKC